MYPRIRIVIAALFAGASIVGCASTAPRQLVAARDAYNTAAAGRAQAVAPAELKDAEQALARAEASFRDDGASARTKDLAYIAERRAEIATAVADRRLAEEEKERNVKRRAEVADELRESTVHELKNTRQELGREEQKVEKERSARIQAEVESERAKEETDKAKAEAEAAKAKFDELRASLARWAVLVENERGLVITLSSGVLFASGRADVLPAASVKLSQVAALLRLTPERHILVEGHTDSVGGDAFNQTLSQARADAVYSYLVLSGVPADRMRAIGYGESRPVATNATIEGRANNRRVEIVLEPLPVVLVPVK